jgi:hypothetical protein
MTPGHAAELHSHPRFRLGFASGRMPGALVILAGAAAGPSGLGLLSPAVLESLDPALPVALAALGVSVGIGFNLRIGRDWRGLTATSVRAIVTMAVVGAGIALLTRIWAEALGTPAWFNGVVTAISAADDPLAVLSGGIALAFLREGTPLAAATLVGEATAVTLVIAAAGWLLLSRSEPGAEQRIFVIALLLLLGGASEYLSLSALTAGLLAGFFWEAAGGSTNTAIRRDVLYVQNPLIALVLLVSGARLVLTSVVLALGVVYFALRVVGTTVGSDVARRLVPSWRGDSASTTLAPGIVGVAFALNALRAAGSDAAIVLSIVVIGVVGSELFAPALRPREAAG